MAKDNLVGRCGLYCGACIIYRAQQDSEAWQKELGERHGCASGKVRCNGCNALTSDCWGYSCRFVVCQRGKGIESCFECTEYQNQSCTRFETFSKNYHDRYGVDLRDNLTKIFSGQREEWLAQSEKRFSCPICDSPMAVGAQVCRRCSEKSVG